MLSAIIFKTGKETLCLDEVSITREACDISAKPFIIYALDTLLNRLSLSKAEAWILAQEMRIFLFPFEHYSLSSNLACFPPNWLGVAWCQWEQSL